MDLTKVGIALLNMKEITDYLSDVAGMVTSGGEELAPDVQTVAGEKADNIAIAYIPKDKDGNPLFLSAPDRETVKNAMRLNGHALSWFWPAFKGEKTNLVLQDLILKTIAEFTELRDEVYQMRVELARKGFLNHYVPYAGFYDTFRQNKVKHLKGPMAVAMSDSTGRFSQTSIHVNDDFFDSIAVGDHVAIINNTNGMVSVVSIKEKGADHETLYFASGCGFNIKKDITEIHRSRGTCLNGAFAFGEIPPMSVDERNEMHTGFDDDTYRRFFKLDNRAPGYACTLRIPEDLQKSYLSKFKISVRAEGQPGSLICTLIDEINIPVWEEIRRRERIGDSLAGLPDLDDLIVAKSMPLYVDPAFGQHIVEFTFKDKSAATRGTYGLANPECYPFLALQDDEEKRRIRYCAIIEGIGLLDENNYYEIKFLNTKEEGDVQKNNLNYIFRPKASTVFTRTDELDTVDLYYGMVLLRAVKYRFVPYNEGIYTARFEEPAPVTSEKVRLAMRINREGVYEVVPESAGNHMDGGAITIVNHAEMGVSSINFSGAEENNHPVIVGTNIRKLAKCDHEILTIEKGFHAEAGDPVYPVGYKVSIKAYLDEWDEEHCVTVTKYEDRFEMPLIAVMPDVEHASVYSSDRLIFEADMHKPIDVEAGETEGVVRPYNRYELEIYWEKSRDVDATITTDGVEKHPFSGAIQNLSLSLDRVAPYNIPYTGSEDSTEDEDPSEYYGKISTDDAYGDVLSMAYKVLAQTMTKAASNNIQNDDFSCLDDQTVFKLTKKPSDKKNILFYINGVKYPKSSFSYDEKENTVTWTNAVKDDDHPDAFALKGTDNVSVVYTVSEAEKSIQTRNLIVLNDSYYKMSSIYSGYDAMTKITDVFDTSRLTNMSGMLQNCRALEEASCKDFVTFNIKSTAGMFANCEALKSVDLTNLNTPSVTNMAGMFYGCKSLKSIDLSALDTSSVEEMTSMLSGCSSLVSVDLSRLDTSAAKSMCDMFKDCSVLSTVTGTIDCSSVTDANNLKNMFSGTRVTFVELGNVKASLKSSVTSDLLKGDNTLTINFV